MLVEFILKFIQLVNALAALEENRLVKKLDKLSDKQKNARLTELERKEKAMEDYKRAKEALLICRDREAELAKEKRIRIQETSQNKKAAVGSALTKLTSR